VGANYWVGRDAFASYSEQQAMPLKRRRFGGGRSRRNPVYRVTMEQPPFDLLSAYFTDPLLRAAVNAAYDQVARLTGVEDDDGQLRDGFLILFGKYHAHLREQNVILMAEVTKLRGLLGPEPVILERTR
jgi:hypothetical protein